MADHISTHYVKSGYATSDDIVLSQTPTTRTVLRPALHAGGVRGRSFARRSEKRAIGLTSMMSISESFRLIAVWRLS